MIFTASGDQFFPTDSAQFYYDDLPGPKYLRTVPNANHGMKDYRMSMWMFYRAIITGRPLPQYEWKHASPGTVQVATRTEPLQVSLWTATNPNARDFRLEAIGPAWKEEVLKTESSGHYTVHIPKPAKGWTAYFVEMKFKSDMTTPYIFTTDARVVPDIRPFKWSKPKSPVGGGAE
jgi:PhoPQ-activated pathogenicity-related protein